MFAESLNDQSGVRLYFMLHCLAMHVVQAVQVCCPVTQTLNQIFI